MAPGEAPENVVYNDFFRVDNFVFCYMHWFILTLLGTRHWLVPAAVASPVLRYPQEGTWEGIEATHDKNYGSHPECRGE